MEQVLATKDQQVRWAARMCFGGKCISTVMVKILWLLSCCVSYANRIPDPWKESTNFGFICQDFAVLKI